MKKYFPPGCTVSLLYYFHLKHRFTSLRTVFFEAQTLKIFKNKRIRISKEKFRTQSWLILRLEFTELCGILLSVYVDFYFNIFSCNFWIISEAKQKRINKNRQTVSTDCCYCVLLLVTRTFTSLVSKLKGASHGVTGSSLVCLLSVCLGGMTTSELLVRVLACCSFVAS